LREPSKPIRLIMSLMEGAAGSLLMGVAKANPSDPDGAMKTLQAISIVMGLPFTFITCAVCFSLWRALQYETGELQWGQNFKKSVIDIGITVYQALPSSGENKKVINIGGPIFDKKHITNFFLFFFAPAVPVMKIVTGIQEKQNGRKENSGGPRFLPPVLAGIAQFLWVAWILFLCLDHVQVDPDGYWERGFLKDGKETHQRVSTRYGTFHTWEKNGEEGMVLIKNSSISSAFEGTEAIAWSPYEPYNNHTLAGPMLGERIGPAMHMMVFGWFFFFLLVGLVTYLRLTVRGLYQFPGNPVSDGVASLCLYPNVLTQCLDTLENEECPPPLPPKKMGGEIISGQSEKVTC